MEGLTKREQDSLERKVAFISEKSKEAASLLRGIQSGHKKYIDTIEKLEGIRKQATNLTKQYKANERQIEIKLNQAERFYEKTFLPIKAKIDNRETGLKKATHEGERFLKEIVAGRAMLKTANDSHSATLKEFRGILAQAKRIDKSTTSTGKSIGKSKEKVEQLLDSARSLLTTIEEHRNQTDQLNKDTIDFLAKSKNVNREIETIRDRASELNENIRGVEHEANSTNDKITKLYEIVTNKSMAGAFDERRRFFSEELEKWNKRVKRWSVSLFGAVVFLLFVQIAFNQWSLVDLGYDFYLRFLFAGPILYYLVFCNAQYNHVWKSLEKYTFKTTIALSIEAHAELLTKNFIHEESTDKTLKFSLDSLNKIYDKPYYDELAMVRIKTEKKEAA